MTARTKRKKWRLISLSTLTVCECFELSRFETDFQTSSPERWKMSKKRLSACGANDGANSDLNFECSEPSVMIIARLPKSRSSGATESFDVKSCGCFCMARLADGFVTRKAFPRK